MGRLEGKNALIIGGSTGIGRAICHRFAEEGAALAVGSPGNEADREDLLGELTGAGHRAVFHQVLGKKENVRRLQ